MLEGSCHCGAVRLHVPSPPAELCLCNCSICRRYGALWAFYVAEETRVDGREHLASYVWGDRTIDTMHCRHCGCVTHWESLRPGPGGRRTFNMRLFDPAEIGEPRLRRFDGADTWRYLDE